MSARFALVPIVAALVAAPPALADGPGWYPIQDPEAGAVAQRPGDGPRMPPIRYDTVASNWSDTVVQEASAATGAFLRWHTVHGRWGIPQISWNLTAGVSRDGRLLVLQSMPVPSDALQPRTSFLLLDTRRLQPLRTIHLHGDFSFDALSPEARMLYVIEHVSERDMNRYVVRAVDLRTGRLLRRLVADRTQPGWKMEGSPLTRVTSANGRWVYTLYTNPAGYPFVHALDTVSATAHCIGIPWRQNRDQGPLFRTKLQLVNGERMLALERPGRRPFSSIDTRTFAIVRGTGGAFPWWALALGGGLAMLAAALGLLHRKRLGRVRASRAPAPTGAAS